MGAESAQQQKRPRHANPTWPCPWTARKRRAGLDGANRGMESLTLYRNGEYLASSAKRFDSNGALEHQDSRSGGISRGRSCRSINAAAQTSATFLRSARPTQLSDIASQAFLDHLLPGLGRVLINVGIGRKSALGANRTQSVCRQCTCIEYGLGRCRGQALCRRARSARSAAFTDLWRFQWLSASDIDLRYARPVSEQHWPDP